MKLRGRKRSAAPGPEEFCDAIGSIYEAAFDLTRWPTAMAKIAHILEGHRALMFVPDMAGRGFWASHQVAPEMMAGYAEHYRAADIWTDRCARFLTKTGSTILGEMVASEKEYSRSEFWNDFSRPADIFRVACVAVEIPTNAPTTGTLLSVFRPHASQQFELTALAFLHAIQPHVLRSLKLGRLIASQASERTCLEAMLAAILSPVLAVTDDARVLYANPAAEVLLREGDGLTTDGVRLLAATGALTDKLARAIAQAAQVPATGPHVGTTLRLPRTLTSGQLIVEVAPLPSNELAIPGTGIQRARVLLVVHCPRSVSDHATARFRESYGLTTAELKLVRTLLDGGALPDVAARLGIRHSTARAQLKTVFAKTQTHHQTDLLRLVHEFLY